MPSSSADAAQRLVDARARLDADDQQVDGVRQAVADLACGAPRSRARATGRHDSSRSSRPGREDQRPSPVPKTNDDRATNTTTGSASCASANSDRRPRRRDSRAGQHALRCGPSPSATSARTTGPACASGAGIVAERPSRRLAACRRAAGHLRQAALRRPADRSAASSAAAAATRPTATKTDDERQQISCRSMLSTRSRTMREMMSVPSTCSATATITSCRPERVLATGCA